MMQSSWFELLFKFSPLSFAEGDLAFGVGATGWLYAVIVAAVLVVVSVATLRSPGYRSQRHRLVSLGLRVAALVLLAVALFEPVLVVPDVVPDENFVAVVVDGSQSMQLADGREGATRGAEAATVLDGEGRVVEGLEPYFNIRRYRFGAEAMRIDSLGEVDYAETATNIEAALNRVAEDFRGIPLAGVLLLTDGADNSDGLPLNAADVLRGMDVPLHVIGLGSESQAPDREILDVTVSEGVEETTGAEIDVKVRSQGAEGGPVRFDLLRGGELVHSFERPLKGDGRIDQFTVFYEPETPEALEYSLQIAEAGLEQNTRNNEIELLIDTRKDTLRVLHFEGQPRTEFKFIKRALDDDPVVQFVSVTRTGSDKLYRQGLTSPDQLQGGFPSDLEELFEYRALIIGDLEAAFFTPGQLDMIESFVRVRGGGFLMLGGLNSFSEGDYWNSPIADVLPVEIDPSRRQVLAQALSLSTDGEQGYPFAPTASGYESPILKMAADPAETRERWERMPRLNSLNLLGPVKPGAVVLAERPADQGSDREPVLAVHRYGRGRAAALSTAGTWRWQMQLDAKDTSHERFWRQLVRWLVASAPGQVDIELAQRRFASGEEVPLTARVFDRSYAGLDGAEVFAYVTAPSGGVTALPMRPDLTEAGRYSGIYRPSEEGVYDLRVDAHLDGAPVGTEKRSFITRPSRAEYRDAALQRSMLTQLAERTGGSFYPPDEADAIPEVLRSRRTSRSIYRSEPLWDMPIIYLLAVLLLTVEWGLRRKRGMP